MLAVFCSEYWLQSLVSFCRKNFKEINLKPWLHSFLLASAYFTCVQVDFVNDYFVCKFKVEVGGVGKTCCLIFIGIFKAVASPAKLFHPKIKGYNFQMAFHDLGRCNFFWTSSLLNFNLILVS